MKAVLWIGVLVLALGVISLFVAVPHTERHTTKVGGLEMGVETHDNEKVEPAISATLIVVGAVMAIAGAKGSK